MGTVAAGVAAIALAGLATPRPAAAATPLDGFLGVFRDCDYVRRDSGFVKFSEALARKFANRSGFEGDSQVDGAVSVPGHPSWALSRR